jgi:hypothetical protein
MTCELFIWWHIGAQLLLVHLEEFVLNTFLHLGQRAALGAVVATAVSPFVVPASLGVASLGTAGVVASKFSSVIY